MKKIKAPIDEKNVCSDFLQELADGYTAVDTSINGMHCCAFYKFDCLWEAIWRSSDNIMSITNMHSVTDGKPELIAEIKEMFSESDLVLDISISHSDIIIHFWWNVEES